MASPFRYFRKHTKAFMATAAVICMFLFVFASGTGGSGANDNKRIATATVATWDGGALNEGQLAQLLRARLITSDFLRKLFFEGGGQNEYDLPEGVPSFVVASERSRELEEEVITTEVFASLATSAGMTVSDEMINYYIEQFGLNRVNSNTVRSIFANTGDGNVRGNEAMVFATLRKLLLAFFYRRAYEDEAAVVMPQQRWEDWRRINEKISLTAAILPVERFLGDVPEPKQADLTRLYDQFKDKEPDLVYNVMGREIPSPDPGFAEPRRVKLQYLSGSVAERTKAILDSVTEEEIADYYERNKRSEFSKMEADAAEDFDNDAPVGEDADAAGEGAADGGAADVATPDETAPAEDEGATQPGEAPAEDTPGADAPPADESAVDAAPAGTEAGPAAASEGSSDVEPATPTTTETPAGDAPAAATGDQSSTERRSPFRFAALQAAPAADAESSTDAAEAEDAGDAKESTAEATDAPAATTKEAAAESEGDAPAADAPAGSTPAEGEATATEGAADAAKPAENAEEPLEYRPLDEVRDEIRETLARDKAVQQLQEQIGEASAKLQTEYNQYGRLVVEAQVGEKPAPKVPEKLANLQWLADEYKLTLVTTEPLTMGQLFELEVGKAVDDQSGRVSVTQVMFANTKPYEPFVAKELEGDWYIVLKTEDTPGRVPAFDEVRDRVALAWRRIEASKLAEKKAQELAKESDAATESFDEFFKAKGYEVVPQTGLFSWRSYSLGPGMGSPAELSAVLELKNVGQDFMEAAFSLEGDETKSILNFDHSAAYVFRLYTRQYTPDELKKRFLEEVNTWMGNADMLRERFYVTRRQLDQKLLVDVAKFKFDKDWEAARLAEFAERN